MTEDIKNLASLGENKLILRLRDKLLQAKQRDALLVDIGDDTAVFRQGNNDLLTLFTCDMMVEDQHFRRSWHPPEKLGWKALASNVSDIAAMGGRPTFALVSIALPKRTKIDYIDRIYDGLTQCADAYGVILAGGDTVGSPQGIVIDVSLLGEVPPDKVTKRSGAQAGDLIAVSGPLGLAAAGLKLLEAGKAASPQATLLVEAILKPQPRLKEAQAMAVTGKLTAMMDLSDGLAEDLPRLCKQSQVGARINVDAIPTPPNCEQFGLDALPLAISGGEDYELLFTFAPQNLDAIISSCKDNAVNPPVVIGEITPASDGIRLIRADGTAYESPQGFQHFG